MYINFIILFLLICLSLQKIKDGIYNLNWGNYYLKYKGKKILISNSFSHNTFLRINVYIKNNNYYYIEQINNRYILAYSRKTKLLKFLRNKKKNRDIVLWNIIKNKNNYYIIQNKNKCYLIIINNNIICEDIFNENASQFNLTMIYEEVKENKKDNELIDKEPIDVLIKYIDLRDPEIKRDGIHQIKKDYDNEELRYSIRSILKNIPWIRKIFILMPNNKVNFLKSYNLIKDKIIYIKDKDILGHDSSNSNSFQFRYWKMYKYGISKNFIIMDDDYFIGKFLNKNDFFYVDNGKVVPLIITSNLIKIEKNSLRDKCDIIKQKAFSSKEEQNRDIYYYSLCLTYSFIIDIFNKSVIIPKFTHNAIPVNLNELKQIYKLVKNSEYKSTTLDSIYRDINSLQFQSFVLSYMFIKYNKKIKDISFKYIDINDSIFDNFNYSLYCINTGGGNYSYLNFYKARIVMNYLFPIPSPYENIDYTLPNIALNVVLSMENISKLLENKYNNIKLEYTIFRLDTIILIIIIILYIKIKRNEKFSYI